MKAIVMLALTLSVFATAATEWKIDPAHSAATFKVRHMMVSNVMGTFTSGIEGAFNVDDKDVTKTQANATIDANTINTRNEKRDGHLKSPDFFDTKKFPKITFKSKRVVGASFTNFKMMGDLTIHGVTKEVTIDVDSFTPPMKDPMGTMRRGMSGTTKLDRKEFGLKWNKTLETGGVVVGETIDVSFDIEMTTPAEKTPKS